MIKTTHIIQTPQKLRVEILLCVTTIVYDIIPVANQSAFDMDIIIVKTPLPLSYGLGPPLICLDLPLNLVAYFQCLLLFYYVFTYYIIYYETNHLYYIAIISMLSLHGSLCQMLFDKNKTCIIIIVCFLC